MLHFEFEEFQVMQGAKEDIFSDADIPPFYINEEILNYHICTPITTKLPSKCYKVKEDVFFEHEQDFEEDTFEEFEVYKSSGQSSQVKKVEMENEDDVYRSTPTDTEPEKKDDWLDLNIQSVPNGYIINEGCFLPWRQWHTLVSPMLMNNIVHCELCDQYCEIDKVKSHVTSPEHMDFIQQYRPLRKFDLSITRKIRNKYHCAVCNEVFDLNEKGCHFSSKLHEGNLLFAINKTIDLLDLTEPNNNAKVDTYHFKNGPDHESVARDTDNHRYINFQHQYHEHDYENDEHFSENDEHFFENDERYSAQESLVFTGSSYASMARKPKVLVEDIEVDLGNKKVQVKFNSWHMVISPKPNRFYCMACKVFDHLRMKQEHCKDEMHLQKLSCCHVVEAYEDYYIRQVDDKLYHCGHCNNLQLKDDIEEHIEKNHPRKTKVIETKNQKINSPIKANSGYNDSKVIRTDNVASPEHNNNSYASKLAKKKHNTKVSNQESATSNANVFKSNVPTVTDEVNPRNLPNIFDNIVISPFGFKMSVSSLAYNVLHKGLEDYYCGLCNMICHEYDVLAHVHQLWHVEALQRVPFIRPFSFNLIRAVRDALHCTICNVALTIDQINRHIRDREHMNALTESLKISNHPKSPETSTVNVDIPKSPSSSSSSNMSPHSIPYVENENVLQETPCSKKKDKVQANIKKANLTESDDLGYSQSMKKESNSILSAKIKENTLDKKTEIEANSSLELEDLDQTFESTSSEDPTFDVEEYVYLKLKNTFIKVSNASYNTLVAVGDGSRCCFVCVIQVKFRELQKHVDSRYHLKNMEKYRFLEKYEDHLLRQSYLSYHCGVCNVIVNAKELKSHLEWPTHTLHNYSMKNMKKTRKNEIKGGVKQIVISTQKEKIYLHEKQPTIRISLNVQFTNKIKKKNTEKTSQMSLGDNDSKKNKLIIFDDNVLKITWEHWNGICKMKNSIKCVLCQRDMNPDNIDLHCNSEWHRVGVDKPFDKQYAPALVREINDSLLNCVICNIELSSKDNIVWEHVKGKRHAKNYQAILSYSAAADEYTDCDDDVLTL